MSMLWSNHHYDRFRDGASCGGRRMRHVMFHRTQILAMVKILNEFPAIVGVDFTYVPETMEPLAMTYLWEDEE